MNAAMAAIAERSLSTPEKATSSVLAALAMAAEGDFGLPLDQIKRIAEKLPASHSAIIGILENVWERKLRNIAQRFGGRVINQQAMSRDEVAKEVGRAVS